MALKSINPFTYPAFNTQAGESIQKLVDYFNDEDPDFWLNTLSRYSFRDQNHQAGEVVRLQFNQALSSCSGPGELHTIANRILEWGGMAPLNAPMKKGLLPSLSTLRQLAGGASIDLHQLCVERLASITKIYEMWDLDNWVIYDSYGARGLQWLISGYWAAVGYKQNEGLLKLPWPPGRAGSPVAGFPRTATTAPKQQRLGFVYGSWICKTIAERLGRSGEFQWRPYHVEMLAFQLGHEVQ